MEKLGRQKYNHLCLNSESVYTKSHLLLQVFFPMSFLLFPMFSCENLKPNPVTNQFLYP